MTLLEGIVNVITTLLTPADFWENIRRGCMRNSGSVACNDNSIFGKLKKKCRF